MTSFNVMAVCDFAMYFTFISAGWEGSAHDARILDHALTTPVMNFPRPPEGKYYLLDKGYADRTEYLVPYSCVKYHQSEFHNHIPENAYEVFNKVHSSLRTTIERCFGVLKKRWKILAAMPSYSVPTQIDIIIACFALHNFVLENKIHDFILDEDFEECVSPMTDELGHDGGANGMRTVRDAIAEELWSNRRFYKV